MLSESLGIEARYWVHEVGTEFADGELTTVDLGAAALAGALSNARIPALELGAVIAATSTPARITGANAPRIAARVGARSAAFDVRAGCAGGLLAFCQGCVLASLSGRPIAVVGADAFSLLIPPDAPLAALSLGDGAAAVVLVPNADGGLLSASFEADGSLDELGCAPSPFPCTSAKIAAGAYQLMGSAEELLRRGPRLCGAAAEVVLRAAELKAGEIDLLIPQQTSGPGIALTAHAIGVELAKTMTTVGAHGNCGTAGIFLALHRARLADRIGTGAKLLLCAAGGGLSWGAAAFRA